MVKALIGVFTGIFIASLACEIIDRLNSRLFKKRHRMESFS